ncbi:hypothetical protein LAJ19_18125 (plasmid) [Deinococcus taeanensis]|uniref:hypothetical protein n=1 Tax=Deinococcus taeanensis TaxID=2737050 RepID=UPI001CDD6F39|nr:hypothetical protein [Deinococcus taeanensis]UBV45043.1 hypothetical protein LAJ19_18125 [Deinococcus taeanensis]
MDQVRLCGVQGEQILSAREVQTLFGRRALDELYLTGSSHQVMVRRAPLCAARLADRRHAPRLQPEHSLNVSV